jgi:hypothetical protein
VSPSHFMSSRILVPVLAKMVSPDAPALQRIASQIAAQSDQVGGVQKNRFVIGR